jgi:hypothetical protein
MFTVPNVDNIQKNRNYHESDSILIPICTVATGAKAMWKYCGRTIDVNRILISDRFQPRDYILIS